MNEFQKLNFNLDDPIEQGISCYKQDEKDKEISSTEILLLL